MPSNKSVQTDSEEKTIVRKAIKSDAPKKEGTMKKASAEVKKPVVQDDDISFIKELAGEVNATLKRDAIQVGDTGGDAGVPYWVRTGIPQLDYAVGGSSHPGFPGARFIEVFGGEGAGKSTLAVWLTKMAMEQVGAIAYYQDAERVLTPEIIRGTGINMDKVMRDQPDTLEEVFDAQEATLKVIAEKCPNKPVVVTLDSVAACSTKAEIEGDMEDSQMASHARLMSKGLRKIKSYVTDTSVLSLWVNQIREKIGVMWGDNTTTSGGKAMAFYASVRIKLSKIKTLKKGNEAPYGCTIEAKIVKNKVAPPLKQVTYDILFVQDASGSYPRLDIEGAILDWCKDNGIIGGSTGRYELDGKSMFREPARVYLMEHPELYAELYEKAYSVGNVLVESEDGEAE